MDTIFTLGDMEDENTKLNLDDLYEKKKKQDLNTLSVYNKILNRIHARIKTISRLQTADQYCWYVIPEMIIGVPKYDNGACIAYIIDKLKENGFVVRYTHPNMLFISWKHWVPSYVRQEIKKKTGLVVDGYGNEIVKNENDSSKHTDEESNDPNNLILHRGNNISIEPKNSKDYKSIDSYKPSGNLIYNQDLLKNIETKSKK
jgi:hypothetical protein